jgi:ferritin-like metal-binding protein YciE
MPNKLLLPRQRAEHLKVTQNQIARLERVFKIIGMSPKDKKCKGMEGLIAEGQAVIKETEDGSATRDVGLIVSAQKVEHYEIAAYGSLRQLAKMTEKVEIAQLLEETLEEEKTPICYYPIWRTASSTRMPNRWMVWIHYGCPTFRYLSIDCP